MIPKFRVFIKKIKKIAQVTLVDFEDNYLTCEIEIDDGIYQEFELNFDEVDFMQSTGLFDNSNPPKEIFEGDVLKNRNYTKNIFICKKSELQAAFVAKTQNGLLVSNFWTDEMHDWEVVGNIYENPELLEAE